MIDRSCAANAESMRHGCLAQKNSRNRAALWRQFGLGHESCLAGFQRGKAEAAAKATSPVMCIPATFCCVRTMPAFASSIRHMRFSKATRDFRAVGPLGCNVFLTATMQMLAAIACPTPKTVWAGVFRRIRSGEKASKGVALRRAGTTLQRVKASQNALQWGSNR